MGTNPYQDAIEHRKRSRTKWHDEARKVLEDAGCSYTETEDGLCFQLREVEGVFIDWFACEKRWYWLDKGLWSRGGSREFMIRYKNWRRMVGS